MNRRTLLVLCSAVVAVVALTTGTSGFSSATADRSLEVSVADDADALLGVERTTSGTANGTTTLTVTVTNRFADTAFEDVEVTVGNRSTVASLAPGERESLAFPAVRCGATVRIAATSQNVQVSLDRSVECS